VLPLLWNLSISHYSLHNPIKLKTLLGTTSVRALNEFGERTLFCPKPSCPSLTFCFYSVQAVVVLPSLFSKRLAMNVPADTSNSREPVATDVERSLNHLSTYKQAHKSGQIAQVVMLLTQNLGRNTDYPEAFRGYYQSI
jgi:hypothetical protein